MQFIGSRQIEFQEGIHIHIHAGRTSQQIGTHIHSRGLYGFADLGGLICFGWLLNYENMAYIL
jgi:hypothetical protein